MKSTIHNTKQMIGGYGLFWLIIFPGFCVFYVLIKVAEIILSHEKRLHW